ncbi:HET-domain-containing protein [Stipitochalara longipes BDJ]|nr:HET-domain-containing protein [Stipitochalara longipes BDJ]
MRLLNASTLKLHEFFGDSIPPYAILSHRWEEQEVTFQDLQDGRGHRMKGWSKIIGCCQQAVEDGFEYAWIDSCCIDKSSSAELSEAINSMYSWYEAAVLCYAYLSDVRISSHYFDSREYPFSCSQWFTRGWTLQELLAPEMVIFFDMHWKEIGTKATLANDIKTITGIDDLNAIHSASVAQKMSWAARRETTRIEDRAYSLMGLFNVNMPTLYGEGERAFLRLQQEIIRTTEDQSIFAWTSHQRWSGLLARSPSSFIDSGDILQGTGEPATGGYWT